jgi:hypothetical protein
MAWIGGELVLSNAVKGGQVHEALMTAFIKAYLFRADSHSTLDTSRSNHGAPQERFEARPMLASF